MKVHRRFVYLAAAAAFVVSGCSSTTQAEPEPESTSTEPSTVVESQPDPDPSTSAEQDGDDVSEETTDGGLDAMETFYAWLEASRKPEPEKACNYLTEELQERMLEEFEDEWGYDIGTCEDLTTFTAELFKVARQGAEVDVSVLEEGPEETTLWVAYEAGSCGTVVLEWTGTRWLINDQSEELCAEPS